MYRQLNSPREMGRRLCFVVYIACTAIFMIGLVATLARPGIGGVVVAAASFAIAAILRQVGYRCMDFGRMLDSFPAGCARDKVPEPVRDEVESLVVEFHAVGTSWVRRAEIRHRLVELEECQPEIIEAYADDLHRVLAA